jgi:FixJ family two-component response regulator
VSVPIVGTKSVAIIEDDASANRALGRLVRSAGFEPTSFDSAESFLAYPARSSFGCLLVDIQLTGMSGLDLQRQLVAEGSRVPLIFITAHEEQEYRTEAIRRGCTAFFRKTDPGSLILEALRQAANTGSS